MGTLRCNTEDSYWAKQAELRERTFRRKKVISHKKVWTCKGALSKKEI